MKYDNLIKKIEKQLESEEQKAGFRKGADALVLALAEMPFDKMLDLLMERYNEIKEDTNEESTRADSPALQEQ